MAHTCVRPNDFDSPRSIYLNSNITPRLSGRFSKFGLLFFVLVSLGLQDNGKRNLQLSP